MMALWRSSILEGGRFPFGTAGDFDSLLLRCVGRICLLVDLTVENVAMACMSPEFRASRRPLGNWLSPAEAGLLTINPHPVL